MNNCQTIVMIGNQFHLVVVNKQHFSCSLVVIQSHAFPHQSHISI